MIIKKIISSILAVAMVAAMSTTVFAEEGENDISGIPTAEQKVTVVQNNTEYDDVLNGNFRSTEVPTELWDLSKRNYNADLEFVNVSWLYTNYYFKPHTDGKIHIDITVYSDTGRPTKMKVGLYDMSKKQMVSSFTSGGSTTAGISESWEFSGLDVNTNYAIAFTAVFDGASRDSVHGTAKIMQQ